MNYIKITKNDIANGAGIRTTLWVSGCSHKCKECHNPQTWNKNYGLEFDKNVMKNIIECSSYDYINGLTLSGGDPLFISNRDEIYNICKQFKTIFPKKTIWCWTGYLWEEVCDLDCMKYIDVLIDGEFRIEEKDISLPYCGSKNQRVIDVKNSSKDNIILYWKDDRNN